MIRRILIFISVVTIIDLSTSMTPTQCGLYGTPPCTFVPAPPGNTPACAGAGKTYCEHIQHYPTQVIKHLIKKWGYDINSLLADETGEEFESVAYRNPVTISHFYGPQMYGLGQQYPQQQPHYQHHQFNQFNSYPKTHEGYKYGPPSVSTAPSSGNVIKGYNSNEGYGDPIYIPRPTDSYKNNYNHHHQPRSHQSINQQQHLKPNSNYGHNGYYYEPQVTQYNSADWLKRYTRDTKINETPEQNQQLVKIRNNRSIPAEYNGSSDRQTFKNIFLDDTELDSSKARRKRQSFGRTALCQTRTQFITPQAALNSKGNWMYVVNQIETARQLVKTETCASSVCSSLCQFPNGYNSRCEQKFVQKRLVALDGTGQRLYTDTFWFPSCCVCTISN